MYEFNEKVNALSRREIYPERPASVETRQTHASIAFLADGLVYKLKKPVNLGFLDYSTLERRRQMCQQEVELNRRLAPNVYLGVSKLTIDDGCFTIDGTGQVADYLVRMRRLDDTRSLQSLIQTRTVSAAQIAQIGSLIADFHLRADRSQKIDRFGSSAIVAKNTDENFDQIQPYIDSTITSTQFEEIRAFSKDFLAGNEREFKIRVDQDRICDGHGDLRAEHVYVENGIEIIDCIEFSDRLRYGDTAVDIGFLLMDLDALNRPDLAEKLLSAYVERTGDDLEPVGAFYRCYRAVVRGKVSSFETNGDSIQDDQRLRTHLSARRFFHLAHRYARGDRSARLMIMYGLTGSGKSTLASYLERTLPAELLDSDTERKRLAGVRLDSRHEERYGAGLYSSEMTDRVYHHLLGQAAAMLARGQTIILDATWLSKQRRESARRLANDLGCRFRIIECLAPPETVRARLANRELESGRVSDGRWEIYLEQQKTAQPPVEILKRERIEIDTTEPFLSQVDTVLARS